MQPETIFSIVNMIALVSWIVLAVGPRWIVTKKVLYSGAVPLLLAIAYAVLIAAFFATAEGGFGSLSGVMKLFTNEWAVLAGWIHYLAFDLLVGTWEVNDAQVRGISHWLVIPCLFFTFMFGPIGYLMYWALRVLLREEVRRDQTIF
ncbi:MAG TPA: ABA4-like family protein [Pyrinomonadaceae bacterium]|nr:ABA4-like family protein [Pyrinomonadaceae bacterium]